MNYTKGMKVRLNRNSLNDYIESGEMVTIIHNDNMGLSNLQVDNGNATDWINEKYVTPICLPFNITFKNKYEHQAVQQFLFDNGCEWTREKGKQIIDFGNNPILVMSCKVLSNQSLGRIYEDNAQYPTYTIADLEIMAEILNPKKPVTEFKLNDEYTAIINPNDNTVKVGCQVFSFETVKELASKL